ncbi:response regulator transcription factor [Gilvibacter sediminis]|uniref:response regulator transcription factor n=1 Tax=Gilvibacter sediminis TaxID=379071 RepID=UPI00235007CD|nr:response regulator transcription factor [Gilvibacter sediminis]MDC7996569.1 response regulator transcription factor [Gilvibacter sediminis]
MKRIILVFGAIVILLMLLFETSKRIWLSSDFQAEWILAVLALVFFGVGIWVSRYSKAKPKEAQPWTQDLVMIEKLGISKRELEVLEALADGLSNKEIGAQLFVSESTVKTHVSNLLVKLDAKRRTEALKRAQELQILPK